MRKFSLSTMCFITACAVSMPSLSATTTILNPKLSAKAANSILQANVKLHKRNCRSENSNLEYPCNGYLAKIIYSSLVVGDFSTARKYSSFKVSKSHTCELYSGLDTKNFYLIDHTAVQAFVEEKLGDSPNRSLVIGAYLCAFVVAGGQIEIGRPNPIPDFPQNREDFLALIDRRLGKEEAKTAERFTEEITVPFHAAVYAIYKKTDGGEAFQPLVLELAINAVTETKRRGFPTEYVKYMEGGVKNAKSLL